MANVVGDGTGHPSYGLGFRAYAEKAAEAEDLGTLTWRDLLMERMYGVLAQTDPEQLDSQLFALIKLAERWRTDLSWRKAPRDLSGPSRTIERHDCDPLCPCPEGRRSR